MDANTAADIHGIRRWLVVAPFIHDETEPWLHSHVDRRLGLDFEVIPVPLPHGRPGRRTSFDGWSTHIRHAHRAWQRAQAGAQPTGIITCFPQLAATVGLRKRWSRAATPIVAWNFNLGSLHGGPRAAVARHALAAVDRFIVHSTAELEPYRDWLRVPAERVQFVPLQQPVRSIDVAEDSTRPFVLAMGSAHRDYATFARAMAIAPYHAVVIAAPHALADVEFPPNVDVQSRLSDNECNVLVQKARVIVIPVANDATASGQVALLTSMMYGRPVIATRCIGTTDYVRDGIDAVWVEPGDAHGLAHRLKELWESPQRRQALGAQARARVCKEYSDEAVAALLASVLNSQAFVAAGCNSDFSLIEP